MIECGFAYTENLLNAINTDSTRKANLINEISIFVILLCSIILFLTHNIALGVIFSIIFVVLSIGLFLTNKAIAKSNKMLLGQQIRIKFNDSNMVMTCKFGDKTLYNTTFEYNAIKKILHKKDLIYLYFDKNSAVIIPKLSFKSNKDLNRALELIGNNYII